MSYKKFIHNIYLYIFAGMLKLNNKYLPISILLILAIIWGSSFILIKRGIEGFPPIQAGLIRIGFAAIILSPFAIKSIKKIPKNSWKWVVIYGFIANLIPAILFSYAETGLSSSLTGILNSLTPMMALVIGLIFFKIKIKFLQITGLVVGLIGSVLLTLITSSGSIGEFNIYAIFVITATICYGLASNIVKEHLTNIKSIQLTSVALFVVGVIAIVFLFTTNFLDRLTTLPQAVDSLIYLFILAALGTAFALILFNYLIQITTAVFATSVTYLIPVFALFWGFLDGEVIYIYHFIGLATIISGVYIINRFR